MPRNQTRKARTANNSAKLRLRGRGDYSADVLAEADVAKRLERKIDHLERSLVKATPSAKGAASLAGRALGSFLGQGDLGAYAGEGLAKLLGYGDYRTSIKGNSLMADVPSQAVPKFHGDGKRGVRLTEREFICNITSGNVVTGSSLFTNQAFPLNPTDPDTFPWLSKIANLFDQWEPHGIVFEFHTTSSTFNGTSQALGAVIMATDYDVNDPIYNSKQVMENADYACSAVPSSSLLHGIECDPKERPLPVMYTKPRSGQLNFSTLGNFQIATSGCSTSGTTLGELWISYDITFYKKQLTSATLDVPNLSQVSVTVANGPMIVPTDVHSQRQITIEQVLGVGTKVIFPPSQGTGRFLVTAYVNQFQLGDDNSLQPTLTNCVLSSMTQTVPGTDFMRTSTFDITAPGAYLLYGLKHTAGSSVTVTAVEVDPDFFV